MAIYDDGDPEAFTGLPIDEWELVDGTGENYGWPTLVRRGGDDDVRLVSGAVPGQPAG
jgi:hypothetical protein